MKKLYVAMVEKENFEPGEVLIDYIRHGASKAEALLEKKGGKRAELVLVDIVRQSEKEAILLIDLKTGRYHQIRFQLSQRGCPIVGDSLYGSTRPFEKGAIMLHHAFLTFPHPITQQEIELSFLPCWEGRKEMFSFLGKKRS